MIAKSQVCNTNRLLTLFIRSFDKTGRIMGTRAAGGRRAGDVRAGVVRSICPLNNLNSFHCIIIKLCGKISRPSSTTSKIPSITLEL